MNACRSIVPPALAGTVVAIVAMLTTGDVAGQDRPDSATVALFDYDRSAQLDIVEQDVEQEDGFSRIDLSYASPDGGRVPAYLYVPDRPGPHAGLLLMHGLPGSRENGHSLGATYARAGSVVLAISAPFARPDGPREDVVTFTDRDRAEQIQLIKDLRRGVDLLADRPDVDLSRIGYVGGSYGGAMGGLLAGVEHRIVAYALFVGDGGLVAHFTGPEDEALDRLSPERRAAWLASMEPIEPMRFVAMAAPSALLFQSGKTDRVVPPADGEAYADAGSEPKTIRWYDQGHGMREDMLGDQIEWMADHIGLDPNWVPTSH